MAKILCRKCGTVSDDSLGGCPNCGEPFPMVGTQPRCAHPAPSARPVKKKKSKLLNFVLFLIGFGAALAVLVPAGIKAYGYLTSPEFFYNMGEYQMAYDAAPKKERDDLIEAMLSEGKYGKAYDCVKKSDRAAIYQESKLAEYSKYAFEDLSAATGLSKSECEDNFRVSKIYKSSGTDPEMYVVGLGQSYSSNSDEDFFEIHYDLYETYYFFYAYDYGAKKLTKAAATSIESLCDDYGIIVDGQKSYKNFTDGDYVGKSLSFITDYSDCETMYYRVQALASSGLLDDAEILGDDKRP